MTNNKKHTRSEVIQEFLSDFTDLTAKIKNNTASPQDYNKLQELIKILGLGEENVIKPLQDNGFNDWASYYNERRNENIHNRVRIGSVLGAVVGTSMAVIDFLNKMLEVEKKDTKA